ncbi:hypothetical protein BVG16_20180 [Paenibacillus selenitireducens]|uniref:Flagellar protein FliT n=1 Tax=Paenibacillus selenitireducens TaxID=1324314 RepID=A0A1T2X7J4_9BACL|nr:hypothetical protein [Paenibacillus selenitireducens]OPA75656.1 hypothetical protein BVG16_20180 [Paenibacillus selenitireducens]
MMTSNDAMQSLHRLREITIALQYLDFSDEADCFLLEELQREQVTLRELLTPCMPELLQLSDAKHIIKQCVELEESLNSKLNQSLLWAEEQLLKLQIGSRSKNMYTNNFVQAEGFFIDRKK